MKFFVCFFLLFGVCWVNTNAQNTYLQSTFIGYSEGSNVSTSLHMDNAGNAYAIINSRYDINFHGKVFSRPGALEYSVLGKFDSSGNLLWSRMISAKINPTVNYTDIIYDLQVDANQSIYISGAGGGITLDDGTLLLSGTFLIKFDKNGNTLWGLISENTQNMSAMTGGPIALANDGVYWSSIFYGKLQLQNKVLNTTNPNMGTPNAFVTKVNGAGKVTAIYQDTAKGSIPEIMVAANNGNASVVISRGGLTQNRVILDENCKPLSDGIFVNYGDFPRPVRDYNNGYEMLTNTYGRDKNGVYPIGYYDIKFNKDLDITDSIKLFPNPKSNLNIYGAINDNNNGYYFTGSTFDWMLMDNNFNQTILKSELTDPSGSVPWAKTFVKMVGDTLNMLMWRNDTYSTNFIFNGQPYNIPYNLDECYFWVKYKYQDPDSCKKVQAAVVQNGKEGASDVKIKFSLPLSCPATEDIVIDTKLEKPETNQNDFIMPATVTIKNGTTSTTLTIPVIDDNYIENTESFTVDWLVRSTATGYTVTHNSTFQIADNDNTEANRVIDVTTLAGDVLENNKLDISLQLAAPYKLQDPLPITITPVNWFSLLKQSANTLTVDSTGKQRVVTITYPDDHVIRTDKKITIAFSALNSYVGSFKFRQNNSLISDTLKLMAVDNDLPQAYFQLKPTALTIKEGATGYVTVKLPDDYVMESATTISYVWNGLGINSDKRIDPITNSVILPALQNSVETPLKILDDNILNPYNSRQIIYGALNSDFNERPFAVTDTANVEITDNEIGVLTIPNAFTPNGDGINDTWQIKGLTAGASASISIFNRYGLLVYHSTKYEPWNGLYNGSPVPVGVYYYTIIMDRKVAASGSLTIIR